MESKFHEQWLHIRCSMSFLIQNIGGVALVKLTVAIEAFLWDKVLMYGKYVAECVEKLFQNLTWNRNVSSGRKILIFSGNFHIFFLLCKKRHQQVQFQKHKQKGFFKLTMSLEKQRHPKAQRICDVLVLNEGKLPLHFALGQNLVKIPDKYIFAHWIYLDMLLEGPFLPQKLCCGYH